MIGPKPPFREHNDSLYYKCKTPPFYCCPRIIGISAASLIYATAGGGWRRAREQRQDPHEATPISVRASTGSRQVGNRVCKLSYTAGWAGTSRVVDRDVFRLGIGLGPRVHHDRFPAVQTLQPLAAPAEGCQLARKANLKVGLALGRGAASGAWFVGSVRPALLTVAAGGISRASSEPRSWVPTGAETRGGRDLTDGQTRLMGFGDDPDTLSLGPFQAFRA